jgi:hypothetical protein
MPFGGRMFEIEFDFLSDALKVRDSEGARGSLPLRPTAVADFYAELMGVLEEMDLGVEIWTTPVEVPDPVRFEEDRTHAAYDPDYARRAWWILLQSDRVLQEFRGRFIGKCSPVHFFWGAFDLAVTRFSGREAPEHPGAPNVADFVVREAYSHEVSSLGFWPGGGPLPEPIFYAYAYPEPEGFTEYDVPEPAYYHPELREFVLPYEAVRGARDPDAMLLEFSQSTYEAAAELGDWDRAALERGSAR